MSLTNERDRPYDIIDEVQGMKAKIKLKTFL